MFRRKSLGAAAAAAMLSAGALTIAGGIPAAGAATSSGSTVLAGTAAPSKATQHPAGSIAASSPVSFELVLKLQNASGAAALVNAVSTPGSASYRHYLTAAQWEAQFSPTTAAVSQASAWLRQEGFTVGATSPDRITISASGTAAQVEHAFGTTLANFTVAGHTVREATSNLSIPTSLSGIVAGAMGVNEQLATASDAGNPDIPGSSSASAPASSSGGTFPPAPGAFLRHPPCSQYYGATSTTVTPPFGQGYSSTVPNVVCGYKPGQLRSAYGLSAGNTGAGSTVAIVDAYGSSTIKADATEYFAKNDPSEPFSQAHFSQIDQTPFDDESECDAPSWLVEQTIDVEAVHTMAPDAHILYMGAQDCIDGLFNSEQDVIDNHLADVVSNSWADTGGDLLDDASTKAAFDSLFEMADGTGMTIQFSSGDDGDNFYVLGFSSANYPSESPYVTAVGGTSLQIGQQGQRLGELGWDEGRSFLCTSNVVGILCGQSQLNQWLPAGPDGASGGYTSYNYAQPNYQEAIVPLDLAERNAAVTGELNRVIPDISAEADPNTGFLIGFHQTLPSGVSEYTETRYGGTSLASPLLAGIVADANQAAGAPVGFLNPTIYYMDYAQPSSIYDVVPETSKEALFREDFAGPLGEGLPTSGVVQEFHELYYRGPETFCDGTGSCESRQEPLTTAPGYDSLTGLGSPGTNFLGVLAAGG